MENLVEELQAHFLLVEGIDPRFEHGSVCTDAAHAIYKCMHGFAVGLNIILFIGNLQQEITIDVTEIGVDIRHYQRNSHREALAALERRRLLQLDTMESK